MEYYLERLENDLRRILRFWVEHVLAPDGTTVFPECSIDGAPNKNTALGSLYLSRILYGASAACRFLSTLEFKPLADLAFKILYERFRNPAGGFYWAKSPENLVIHDSDNTSMAQAFVLYGLAEYAHLTQNPVVEAEMKKLQQFLYKTIKDNQHGGYLDGYSADWKQEKNFTKSLGTHLHLMEALVKQFQYSHDNSLKLVIIELIDVICSRFINASTYECYHRLTFDWNRMPDFNWAGHNAEVSWLITHAAMAINNKELFNYTSQIAIKLTGKVVEQAFDTIYGGVFNELKSGLPAETNKTWWPQAEVAIACMNAYQLTKDNYYLNNSLRQLEYIENNFSDSVKGEWYTSVTKEGKPLITVPKVHLWKSMYHNVRYCIEMSERIRELIRR